MYNVLDDNNSNMILCTLIIPLLIVSNHCTKSEYAIARVGYCLDFSMREQNRSTVSAAAEVRAILLPIRF